MKFERIVFCLILSLGCASLPRRERIFPPAGKEYISLSEFARRYDFNLDFDPFLKKILLSKGEELRLVFALESPLVLVNGEPFLLQEELKILEGDIKISSRSVQEIINYLVAGRRSRLKPRYRKDLQAYKIRKIILDPGHGGKDPGAIGPSGLREKDVVLEIAKLLKEKLTRAGYEVVMTREEDRYISLWRRIYIANREAGDLFISLHANSARYRSAYGFEVYYLSEAEDELSQALLAAENYPLGMAEAVSEDLYVQATIWDLLYSENRKEAIQLAKRISSALNKEIATKNRGVKGANFYVLRGTQMPAVLIEVGFISNRFEEKRLRSWDFKNRIANAVVEGIRAYESRYALRGELRY